jgi:hypothetical protein
MGGRIRPPGTGLGSVAEHPVRQFVAIVTLAIGLFLAPNTKCSPWDRRLGLISSSQ